MDKEKLPIERLERMEDVPDNSIVHFEENRPLSGRLHLTDTRKFIEAGSEEFPLLTIEQEFRLGTLVKRGDRTAFEKLVNHNQRLVFKFAKRYMNMGLPLPDLYQEGMIGLMHAVEKFDPYRRIKFSTYAVWWIRMTVGRSINEKAKTVRAPVYVDAVVRDMKTAEDDLRISLEREPTKEEVREYLGITEEVMSYAIQARWMKGLVSLQKPATEEGDDTIGDFVGNDEPELHDQAMHGVRRSEIATVLEQLDEEERKLIVLRYGLEDEEPHTHKQIGDYFGISRESARTRERKILDKLLSTVGILRIDLLD